MVHVISQECDESLSQVELKWGFGSCGPLGRVIWDVLCIMCENAWEREFADMGLGYCGSVLRLQVCDISSCLEHVDEHGHVSVEVYHFSLLQRKPTGRHNFELAKYTCSVAQCHNHHARCEQLVFVQGTTLSPL